VDKNNEIDGEVSENNEIDNGKVGEDNEIDDGEMGKVSENEINEDEEVNIIAKNEIYYSLLWPIDKSSSILITINVRSAQKV